MKGIRDCVFTQVLSKSFASSRPLFGSGGFFQEAPSSPEEESGDQGSSHITPSVALSVPPDTSGSSGSIHDNDPYCSQQQILVEDSNLSHDSPNRKKMDPLTKIENLQIKFLRLLQWLGQSQDNFMVAKVLYRMDLATLI